MSNNDKNFSDQTELRAVFVCKHCQGVLFWTKYLAINSLDFNKETGEMIFVENPEVLVTKCFDCKRYQEVQIQAVRELAQRMPNKNLLAQAYLDTCEFVLSWKALASLRKQASQCSAQELEFAQQRYLMAVQTLKKWEFPVEEAVRELKLEFANLL